MAWIRQLPPNKDGQRLWAATVYSPTGRVTESDRLKGAITKWAADREAEIRAGDWLDPRAGRITVGEWWERCKDSRHLELASRKRDASHWRCHVEPKWRRVPIGAILKPDVSAWVVEMDTSHRDDCRDRSCKGCRVGAATIEGAVGVLIGLLDQAVDAKLIRTNPARGVPRPRRAAHVDRVLSAAEELQLLERLDEHLPGRPDARLFVELLLDTGMRWEEAAAIPRELVELRRGRISIANVMERDGSIRPYAKSEAGDRTVAVSDLLAPRLRAHVMTISPGGLVFTAPAGGPLWYSTWLRRVWHPALWTERPVEPEPRRPGQRGPLPKAVKRERYLPDPQPTPHDMRHTFGTRLADEGVPVHDIAKLMGHKDLRSAQRYLHSGEDRFSRARDALDRARGRIAKSDHSPVTHDLGG